MNGKMFALFTAFKLVILGFGNGRMKQGRDLMFKRV
ncbi:hypothetical protein RRG08_050071 [Elysia crispata]|uniref:Uncharacterized protein n=1 Tax=Elysia crispata TaxID=231223 RepID=A0AAE1E1Q7_9GAST|nr:hypothetical protein RRG08_050071 [Elysia crispata]